MTDITLKKVLYDKAGRATALTQAMHLLDPALTIENADGTWLIGPSHRTERQPILLDGQPIGWVASETHAPIFAALMGQALAKEMAAKLLGYEVLGLYREINLLYNLSERLATNPHVATVARTGLDQADTLIRTTHGAVVLFAEGNAIDCRATLGDESQSKAYLQSIQEIIRSIARIGKAEVVNNLRQDPRYIDRGESIHSMVCAPLKAKQQSIGVIVLMNTKRSDYTARQLKLLNTLSSFVGPAIENALLYEKTLREGAAREKQLKQESAVKSALLGMITHELRSPFVSAGFSVELLTRYAERQMYTELDEQIRQLARELAQGRQMIDGIISFASLMSKRVEMHQESVNIATLIEEAIVPLRKMAESRHVDLSVNVQPQLAPAQVDPERMSEAIYHLVHNAIKFNVEGGRVLVSCHAVDSKIEFVVQDTGIGIPIEKLDGIWDAFTQTADGMRRGVEGLGLGLALVKFVVEAHGGTVAAKSELGKGSTFGFWIPAG